MKSVRLLLAVLTACSVPLLAQEHNGVAGNWRTPAGAIVRVASCGNDLCVTLLQLEPNAPRLDIHNPDPAKRAQPLCRLQIGYGFHLSDPDHADGGHIYDPKSGKTYQGQMTAEGDHLHLRGFVGVSLFGRTEQWTRASQPPTGCS